MPYIKKFVVTISSYENGEVIATAGSGKDEKDIYFDTIEEAQEYAADVYNNEFQLCYTCEAIICEENICEENICEENCINYKALKVKWAEEKEKRRLYLKPCPFCGKSPIRNGTYAKCEICDIKLLDSVWNERKYHW